MISNLKYETCMYITEIPGTQFLGMPYHLWIWKYVYDISNEGFILGLIHHCFIS